MSDITSIWVKFSNLNLTPILLSNHASILHTTLVLVQNNTKKKEINIINFKIENHCLKKNEFFENGLLQEFNTLATAVAMNYDKPNYKL